LSVKNYSLDENQTVGCGCAACQNGHQQNFNSDGSLAQNNGSGGGLDAPSTDADPTTFANYLTQGFWEDVGGQERSWTQNNITFSLNGFSSSNQAGLRQAFDMWSDVADISFTEISGDADIDITNGNDGRAYARTWTSGTSIARSDISIDTGTYSWGDLETQGGYGFMSALHEIGHSLGLGHTGNYNGSASYNNDAQWTNDTHQTTVMSYFSAGNVGSDHRDDSNQWQYSASPMLFDIVAIQNIYGADYTTRNTDTTYGFNSNAGYDQYDYSITEVPFAIWDGGGIDTIDVSGYSTDQVIYLTEGDFSSTGNMTNNLVIAYGAQIENAIGGSGDDSFFANNADNNIDGGLGDDVVEYFYNVTEFSYNFISNTVVALTNLVDNFTDTISNIENFIFADSSYSFAQLKDAYGAPADIGVKLYWNGGDYNFTSDSDDTTNLNATEMGYSDASGNVATIIRNSNDITVTVHNNNAPETLRLIGSNQADNITINGLTPSLAGQIHAGAGHDIIDIQISGNHRVYAQDGDDSVTTLGGNDIILGGAGNDTITAGAGRDKLQGEDGNDTLHGGADGDWLFGDAGNDTLNGDAGSDIIRGGTGQDTLNGGDDYDRLYGEDGDDTLHGGNGNDRLYGGDDNDTLHGGAGQDFLYGENGHDELFGDDLADYLYGQAGDDTLHGGNGNDRLDGGSDFDILYGDAGADLLLGESGNDILYGGNGNDRIYGGDNDDTIYGDAHNDIVYAGNGNDTINGGSHNDTLNGESGNDIILGGSGDDKLYGASGNDTLIGGAGIDLLYGGTDSNTDVFGFSASENSEDRIYNFVLSDDEINITDLLSGYTHGTSDIEEFVNIAHTGSRFDVQVDRDGGGNSFESVARVFTDISDSLTATDLLNSGTLIANESLA
jgi:serralysin